MEVTRESLMRAAGKCRPGNHLGDVSHAVQEHVEANGFAVVRSAFNGVQTVSWNASLALKGVVPVIDVALKPQVLL